MDTQLIASFRLKEEKIPEIAKRAAKWFLFFVILVPIVVASFFTMFFSQELIIFFAWFISFIIVLYWGGGKPHYYKAAYLDFFQDKMEVKMFITEDKSENLVPDVHHVFLYKEKQNVTLRYILPQHQTSQDKTIFQFRIGVIGSSTFSQYEIGLDEGPDVAIAEMQKVLHQLHKMPKLKVLEINSQGEKLHLLMPITPDKVPQKYLDLINEIGEKEE